MHRSKWRRIQRIQTIFKGYRREPNSRGIQGYSRVEGFAGHPDVFIWVHMHACVCVCGGGGGTYMCGRSRSGACACACVCVHARTGVRPSMRVCVFNQIPLGSAMIISFYQMLVWLCNVIG